MNREELHDTARRQPFEPFRITLTTGATYDIRHPDLIMVGRRSATIGITQDAAGIAYDRTVKVDLLHIVAIEELTAPPTTSDGPA